MAKTGSPKTKYKRLAQTDRFEGSLKDVDASSLTGDGGDDAVHLQARAFRGCPGSSVPWPEGGALWLSRLAFLWVDLAMTAAPLSVAYVHMCSLPPAICTPPPTQFRPA